MDVAIFRAMQTLSAFPVLRWTLLFCSTTVVLGCGGKSLVATKSDSGEAAKGNEDSGVTFGDSNNVRIPLEHRPAGAVCPQERGTGSPVPDSCRPDGSIATNCWDDSECTEGTNGRCLFGGRFACMSYCSYDACNSDADCPGGVPCDCRKDASSFVANTCVTNSNCAVDADCGLEGFCSPSLIGILCVCPSTDLCPDSAACYAGGTQVPCSCGDACGHGYFCHTPSDTCMEDSDCDSGDSCSYDRLAGRWRCTYCWPVP